MQTMLKTPTDECSAGNLRTSRVPARLRALWLLAACTICAFPFSVNVVDPDLWGHVQYGQDWLAEGTLPRFSSHNFTAVGYPWINHENLAELALAKGFENFGNLGMLLFKFSLGLSLVLVAFLRARKKDVANVAFWTLAILASYALHPFWLFRPQLATWLGLALMIGLFDRAFRQWHLDQTVRWRWLAGLPVLFVLWTNAHGGFLAGLCLMVAYFGGRTCEAIWPNREQIREQLWQHPAIRKTAGLAVVAAVSLLATLLNPYGIELHQWLVASLGEARPEIIEWHRPSILAPVFAPFFVLVLLSLLSWCVSDERRDWTHGLVLMLTLVQALLHIRHIGLFSVLALLWLPSHFSSLLKISFAERLQSLFQPLASRNGRLGSYGSPATIVCCFIVALTMAALTTRRLTTLPVLSKQYPVQALQFMKANDIQGRLVVSFNWAQYAIAALQPDSTVGFDGRFRTCYPQQIIDKHFDLLIGQLPGRRNRASQLKFEPTAAITTGDPELVLLDRQFPHSLEVLQQQKLGYRLIYEDNTAQLWSRRDADAQRQVTKGTADFGNPEWPAL